MSAKLEPFCLNLNGLKQGQYAINMETKGYTFWLFYHHWRQWNCHYDSM